MKEERERLLREKPKVIPEQEPVIEDKCSQPRTGLQKEEETVTPADNGQIKPVYIKQCDKFSRVIEIDDGDEDGDSPRKESSQVHVIDLEDDAEDDDHNNLNSTPASTDTKVDHDSKGCNLGQGAINPMIDGVQNGNHSPSMSTVDEVEIVAGNLAGPRSSDPPSVSVVTEPGLAGEATNADVQRDVVETVNAIWHYMDPSGIVQGPFKLDSLRQWWDLGYFRNEFKVWRHDRTQEEAVYLYDVLKLVENYQCPM